MCGSTAKRIYVKCFSQLNVYINKPKNTTVEIGSKCSALQLVKFVCHPLIHSTGVLFHSKGLGKESSGVHERPVGLHI